MFFLWSVVGYSLNILLTSFLLSNVLIYKCFYLFMFLTDYPTFVMFVGKVHLIKSGDATATISLEGLSTC